MPTLYDLIGKTALAVSDGVCWVVRSGAAVPNASGPLGANLAIACTLFLVGMGVGTIVSVETGLARAEAAAK